MKQLFFIISFSLCAIFAQAQFRLAVNGTPSWTNLGGGLYSATMTFHADLTGNSYAVAGIVDTMRLFTSRGQVFEVDSVWGKTFSQATLRVEYVSGVNSAPVGQGMVYAPNPNGFVPDLPFGSTGATAQFNQMPVTYNASLTAAGGGVSDGDKGDVDVNSGVWTVDTSAITWWKLSQPVKDSIAAGDVTTVVSDTLNALPAAFSFKSADRFVFPDSTGTFQKLINQVRDSTIFSANTYADIIKISTPLKIGDRIIVKNTGAEYLVQADSISNYVTDGIAVIDVGANYAVLQPSNGFYLVDWFGATPDDNSDDDFAALNKAISLRKGNVKFSPFKTYKIGGAGQTNGFTLNPGQIIDGQNATIYTAGSTVSHNVFVLSAEDTNVVIRDINFWGERSYPDVTYPVLSTSNYRFISAQSGGKNVTVENIFCYGTNNGMKFTLHENLTINNIKFEDCLQPLMIFRSNHVNVDGFFSDRRNVTATDQYHHTYIDETSYSNFSNFHFIGGNGKSFHIKNAGGNPEIATNINISGVTMDSCGSIYLGSVDNINISNVAALGCLYIFGGEAGLDNLTATNINFISKNNTTATYLFNINGLWNDVTVSGITGKGKFILNTTYINNLVVNGGTLRNPFGLSVDYVIISANTTSQGNFGLKNLTFIQDTMTANPLRWIDFNNYSTYIGTIENCSFLDNDFSNGISYLAYCDNTTSTLNIINCHTNAGAVTNSGTWKVTSSTYNSDATIKTERRIGATLLEEKNYGTGRIGIKRSPLLKDFEIGGDLLVGSSSSDGSIFFGTGANYYLKGTSARYYFSSASTKDRLLLDCNGSSATVIQNLVGDFYIDSNQSSKSIIFKTQGTNRLSILSTGRLNFAGYTATSSYPGTTIGLLGFDGSGNITSDAAGDILDAGYWKIGGQSFTVAPTIGPAGARPMHFQTNGTRRFSIPSSGIAEANTSTKALVLSSNDSLGYKTLQSGAWSNTVTQSGADTLLNTATGYGHLTRVGNYVTFTLRIEVALTNSGNTNTLYIDPPVASNFTNTASDVIGTANMDTQSLSSNNTARQRALVFASTSDDKIGISIDPVASLNYPENRFYISVSGSYEIK